MTLYDVVPTPVGPVTVEMADGRIRSCRFGRARLTGGRRARLAPARRWLRAFFARSGPRPPLDLGACTPFERRVYAAARRIPPGRTTTYGSLARAVGSAGAARAVGGALGRNPVPLFIP
jgi:methylated-DNA-[protein]-cysteine S-methyltransferase